MVFLKKKKKKKGINKLYRENEHIKSKYSHLQLTTDLEVKVCDVFGVQILNAIQDLLQKLRGLLLCQRLLLGEEVEQLPSRHQLQDQDHVGLVFEDVVQGDDVAVLDLPQDVHFALDLVATHPPPAGGEPPLFDELGCVFHARALLLTLTHNCKLPTVGGNRDVLSCRNMHKNLAPLHGYEVFFIVIIRVWGLAPKP